MSKKIYIVENINDLKKQDRIHCFKLILKTTKYNSNFEKGAGIYILFKCISDDAIDELYNYITRKIQEQETEIAELLKDW